MDKENLTILLVAIYGNMQTQMEKVELCNEYGVPRKPKTLNEEETIKLYGFISNKLRNLSRTQLQSKARLFNKMVKSLFNEEQLVNNYLMALMLYRAYLDDYASPMERNMHKNKVSSQIKVFEDIYAKNKKKYKDIQKVTSRVVDNLIRILTDRPQLTDEIRNLYSKRYLKGVQK